MWTYGLAGVTSDISALAYTETGPALAQINARLLRDLVAA